LPQIKQFEKAGNYTGKTIKHQTHPYGIVAILRLEKLLTQKVAVLAIGLSVDIAL
jgi:hypothetical protein